MNTPGIELKTIDNSEFVSDLGTTTAFGMLINSNKGPIKLTPVSNQNQFIKLYGESDINLSESHFHALKVLSTNQNLLYCKRVQNGAKYAGCVFYQNRKNNPTSIDVIDFPYGTENNYEKAGFKVFILELLRSIEHNEKISVVISNVDGETETVEQEYVDSSNNTLQLFTTKLKEVLLTKYNVNAGVVVKTDNTKPIQPEIIRLTINELIAPKGNKLKLELTNVQPDLESYTLRFSIEDLEQPITMIFYEEITAALICDYINNNELYSQYLLAEKESDTVLYLTAKHEPEHYESYFDNWETAGFMKNTEIITPEVQYSISFNIPSVDIPVQVTSTAGSSITNLLLDFNSQLLNYSSYFVSSVETESNSLLLVSKLNYKNYFSNIIFSDTLQANSEVVQEGYGLNNNRQIIITTPTSSDVEYTNYTLQTAAGVSETQEIIKDTELFNVFAENPGDWGNKVGVSIVVDPTDIGTKETYNISISNLATGVQFSGSFDLYSVDDEDKEISSSRKTYNISSVVYLTNDEEFYNGVLNELINAIKIDYNSYNGAVYENNIITLQSPKAGVLFDLKNLQVLEVPGAKPELKITKEIFNISGKNTFTLNVVEQADLSNVLESFKGSLYNITDTSNNSINISEIINNINKSDYIRIKQFSKDQKSGLEVLYSTPVNLLNGGQNGKQVTAADYVNSLEDFNDETIDIMALVDDGFDSSIVKQELVSTAEKINAVALLSIPKSYCNTWEQMKHYRNNILGINSCYGAILGPIIQTLDNKGIQIDLTTGGYFAERVAYTEANFGRHYAAAGQRGTITGILGINKNFKRETEYSQLYPNQINLIRNVVGAFQIDGIRTLQRKETALQKLPVVLVRNMIAKKLYQMLQGFIYELNTLDTRDRVTSVLNVYMSNLNSNNVISSYSVVCDETNNTPADIDAGKLKIRVGFVPTGIIEFIEVSLVIEKNQGVIIK